MSDCMNFPNDWHTFLNDYSFKDSQEVYTNGSNLIPTFRVEQLIEYYFLNSRPNGFFLHFKMKKKIQMITINTNVLIVDAATFMQRIFMYFIAGIVARK